MSCKSFTPLTNFTFEVGLPGMIIYIDTGARLDPDSVTEAAGGNFAVSTATRNTECGNGGRRVTVGITPGDPRYNPMTPLVDTLHQSAPHTVTV